MPLKQAVILRRILHLVQFVLQQKQDTSNRDKYESSGLITFAKQQFSVNLDLHAV